MKLQVHSLGAVVLSLLTVALLLTAGCVHTQPPVPSKPPIAKPFFVNETECQTCHAAEYKTHVHSRHSNALHLAEQKDWTSIAPPIGPIANTPYAIRKEGDGYAFYDRQDPKKTNHIDLAMGSGKLAITYVSLSKADTVMELRMSYYPDKKHWYVTPGQEGMADHDLGYLHHDDDSRACISCHAILRPEDKIKPETAFLGVRCQSCHGPASAHVEAMQSGKSADLKIERIGTWGATRINEMCGTCHRSPNQVGTSGNEITMTQRFQPYGLMQSPCFQKSGDRLSCVTCHDPHKNVARDPQVYEAACLRCHSSATLASAHTSTPGVSTANTAIVKSKVCPVNPTAKCVGCHMPTRKVFPGSDLPIAMADHLIWAYGKKASSPLTTGKGH